MSARAIFATLLCAAGVGLLAGCGGGGETVTVIETAPPATAPSDAADDGEGDGADPDEGAEPAPPRSLQSFQTPSGNIACVLGDDAVRCDIAERDWRAPRPAGCPGGMEYGQGLELSEDNGPGRVVCAGDTALDPSAPVLGYGERAGSGDFTCASEEAGVTCRDDGDNRGFFISKQSYRVF